MPVVSGVITLKDNLQVFSSVLSALRKDERITIGEQSENRLPVVICSKTIKEDKQVWDQILNTDGVLMHHVVYADFQDLIGENGGGAR